MPSTRISGLCVPLLLSSLVGCTGGGGGGAGGGGISLSPSSLSFTVDPEYDTPQVLRDYAARFAADPERWLFLTGPRDQVYSLIRESFHLAVEANETPDAKAGYQVELVR